MDKPTVFIVDDDQAVRDSLRWVIDSAGWQAETYASAQEFLGAYDPERPGCLVLDVRMPGDSGLTLQQILNERGIHIPIIFMSAHGTIPTAVRAMHAGAVDFLTKPFNNETLLERIGECIGRDQRVREQRALRREVVARLDQLTPREREVMDRVIAGKLNKTIAAELNLSSKTVEAHRAKVMEKMRARSLAELVRMVLNHRRTEGNP